MRGDNHRHRIGLSPAPSAEHAWRYCSLALDTVASSFSLSLRGHWCSNGTVGGDRRCSVYRIRCRLDWTAPAGTSNLCSTLIAKQRPIWFVVRLIVLRSATVPDTACDAKNDKKDNRDRKPGPAGRGSLGRCKPKGAKSAGISARIVTVSASRTPSLRIQSQKINNGSDAVHL
jgi:hypothetical protein